MIAETKAAVTQQVKARPLTALGLVLALAGAGFGGIGLTVAGERYELRLLKAQDNYELLTPGQCDAIYARTTGDDGAP